MKNQKQKQLFTKLPHLYIFISICTSLSHITLTHHNIYNKEYEPSRVHLHRACTDNDTYGGYQAAWRACGLDRDLQYVRSGSGITSGRGAAAVGSRGGECELKSGTCILKILNGYYSILALSLSCFMWSAALDSSSDLLSYPITLLA